MFVFLLAVYTWLPNTEVGWRDALPGALLGAFVLEASFQTLPLFVRFANVNVTLRTLGGPAILLIWLYVMANVIVFGGELNWWWRERQRARAEVPAQRMGAMRVRRLPVVPQFRHRPLLALRNEDRVVAEALAPAGSCAIRPVERPVPRSSSPCGVRRTSSET